jgi:periplasmic copper chaperone A
MRSHHLRTSRTLRALATIGIGGAAVVALTPTVAGAHLAPDPSAVEAGTAATIGFVVEHGCDDSPTVELRFEVPSAAGSVQPVAKEGWTSSVDGRVVTFAGGSLDAHTSGTFELEFTAPAEASTMYFPVVQRCDEGENPWIQIPATEGEELERPAPAVRVTEGPPTSEDASEEHHDGGGGGHHETEPAEEVDEAELASSTSSGSSGVDSGLIAAGVVAVVIVGGTAVAVRSRRETSG